MDTWSRNENRKCLKCSTGHSASVERETEFTFQVDDLSLERGKSWKMNMFLIAGKEEGWGEQRELL